MTIAELVSGPPLGCAPDTPIVEVAEMMMSETVGSLAVMDGLRLLGIVTDRDIVEAVANGSITKLTAGDIMTAEPDTIDVDTEIDDATDWLNATGYRHLPVTEDDKLVGIVSIKDLLWAVTGR
jgi:CBS domain-containing protein